MVNECVGDTGRRTLKAGGLYVALVFGAGFVLGTIRVVFLVPVVGSRMAELMEMPVMFGVIVFAARWVVRALEVSSTVSCRLGMGGIALVLILALECSMVLGVRGLSFHQYVEAFDPIAGTAYVVMLGIFAVMPFLVSGRKPTAESAHASEGG